jgi:hypothetical protein
MMEAVRTSEMSVDNHFTRQYIPEDNSEHQPLLLSARGSLQRLGHPTQNLGRGSSKTYLLLIA